MGVHRRDGGDAIRDAVLHRLAAFRDVVLEGARLRAGDHLLDVGTGDGLVGFGALQRLGASGRVTFSDVSEELLLVCRDAASELGLLERCAFVNAAATDLSEIPDGSVDVVTTRSVLIYVAAKGRACAEFHRVLRPGGRLSILEPVNRYMTEPENEFMGYPASGVEDLVAKVRAASCSTREDPMVDFDDATLLAIAEGAGFTEIESVLRRCVRADTESLSWEHFLASSPNPLAPTWREALALALSAGERERFCEVMRPRLFDGDRTVREALATLTAVRPA